LSELLDVTISSIADKHVLRWSSGSSKFLNVLLSLANLSDVSLSSPSSGQALKYDGSNWVNAAVGGAENPGANVTTIGAAEEGSETANSSTWTAGGTNGLALYEVTRIVYNHTSALTLYAYVRLLTFDKYGRLYSVGAETRVAVDVPEAEA
jgi:hypothetical protein